jgi:hypothetical protein
MRITICGQEYWTRSEYFKVVDLPSSASVVMPPPDIPKASPDSHGHSLYLENRQDILALLQECKDRAEADITVDFGKRPLGALYGQRKRFIGTFERKGKKRAYRGWGTAGEGYDHTLLLKDIKDDSGRIVADHLWFNSDKGLSPCSSESRRLSEL